MEQVRQAECGPLPAGAHRLIVTGLDEARADLIGLAAASLLAATITAIVQVAEPFEHGAWLISYLVLVGGLAPYLLGRGQVSLLRTSGRAPVAPRPRKAQVVLWAIGVLTVPVGVLVDARLFVVLGSVALLSALASFWDAIRPALTWRGATPSRSQPAYVALFASLAASTLVGTALAWDIPWL